MRVSIALLLLLHGIAKLLHGLGDVATTLERVHVPAFIGYLVYVGKVLAPVLMILGLWTRAAALLVCANMAVALFLGHPREILAMTTHGGLLLEVQWLYLLGALAVALLGAGRCSAGGAQGRWN